MSLITLTTDFGTGDYSIAQMKAVILSISPSTRLVDLSHEIPPQDILTAQILLEDTVPYFPESSIHLVVVDPGVGTQRRPIAARLGDQCFVGPDNGLVTPLLERAEASRSAIEIVHTNRPSYWRKTVSNVFHGRDIFAPIAASLALGIPLFELGDLINDPIRSQLPAPQMVEGGWSGQVIQVDHFGNLALNLKGFHLDGMRSITLRVNTQAIHGLSRTFGDQLPGELIAILDSSNRLSICVVNGSAAERLKAGLGTVVEVHS